MVERLRADLQANDRRPLSGPGSGMAVAADRAAAVDRALAELAFPLATDGLALVATGGFGRSQLAPGSDVDLLLLHAAGRHDEASERFSAVLYPLWDAGLRVGHAIRTPDECAVRDLRTITSMLSARLLAGEKELLEDGSTRVVRTVTKGSWFLDELRASRIEREARAGRVSDSQAPDLRDGLGGLRDLHVGSWLSVAVPGLEAARPDDEPRDFADVLWRARVALHRVSGSTSNVLALELQAEVAALLGVEDEPGWEARDATMRDLHRSGRHLAWTTERLLEESRGRVGARGPQPARLADVEGRDGALEVFARLAEEGGRLPEPSPRFRPMADAETWTEATRRCFLRILASGEGGARAMEALDVLGVMDGLVPEWAEVRGRPQRDPYHRFPVDVHLVQSAAQMAKLLHRPDEPFAAQAAAAVADPEPLLLGALLHDIGKVGRGSHLPAGVEVAARILDRMDAPKPQREVVLFLVREHLLLSDTATRRNLEDEDLILHVAARIGAPERLAMLYLLTVADALATGPAATTPWRLGLIRELVAKVSRVFDRGDMDRDRASRLEAAEASFRDAVAGYPGGGEFVDGLPAAYLLAADPADASAHLRLMVPRPGATEVRTHVRPGRAPGTHVLTVGAVDRPGLLARIAGALTLSGLSVLQAQAFTTEQGLALDAFEVGPAFDEAIGEERWRRFRTLVRHAIEGRIDVRDRIETLRAHYRPARGDIPVTVRIDQEASDFFTVVEVGAADRLGLLFDLARTFADQGLDVHLAKVATYGARVVDVFYVTDQAGQKLDAPERTAPLEEALRRSAGSAV